MLEELNIYVQSLTAWLIFTISFFSGYLLRWFFAGKRVRQAESRAKILTDSAQKDAEARRKEAELQAKDLMIKLRQDFERETKERREEILSSEKRLQQKEENLDKRLDLLDRKEKDINTRLEELQKNEISIQGKNEELEKVLADEKKQLQKISSMTEEDAKKLLLSRLDEELLQEKAVRIRQMEDEIKDSVDKRARNIISTAIQRCASEHTSASTVTVVTLPSDEMKGRIIGREGRNIRALEAAAGVDVIIDDTPEAVTISGFDMYRREIAKIALQNLIADGRIHPGRIEEVVERAKKEMDAIIKEEGEKTAFDLGIHGMHLELLKLVGRLKFRTSYGQNGLQHTKEVAMLIGSMASQLGLDAKIAMRAGLLHDIGKVVSQDVEEGTHAIVGGNLCRKYNEPGEVANAVESHHEEVEMTSIYGALVCAADAISAARPGARAETLETYVKRLESLEKIANSFKGVSKTYALQAGREIRVIVDPDKINDDESIVMARDIRKKIEEGMEYPGQIKVIVLREKRVIEFAK
ncbi:MAG: ribonuclease Y [Omnitrophica WOR_2 bacterium RIFCSPHIGHO2_02_FULL_52_10]|nr:MAG: ribonuclease Y [Omnitrophica WOR_2 bacterium RIFCSPHIGHO2_02_FULL_52_10]